MTFTKREPRNQLPKGARYPIFLLGLLVLVVGELAAWITEAGVSTAAVVGVVGFVLLILSIAIK